MGWLTYPTLEHTTMNKYNFFYSVKLKASAIIL